MTSNFKFIVLGVLIGILASLLGVVVYINWFVSSNILEYLAVSYRNGLLNKIIALGNLPNLGLFFLLLPKKQSAFSKGILISVFISALGVMWLTIN